MHCDCATASFNLTQSQVTLRYVNTASRPATTFSFGGKCRPTPCNRTT